MEAHVLLVFDVDAPALINKSTTTPKDQIEDMISDSLKIAVSQLVGQHFKEDDGVNLTVASSDLDQSLRYLVRKNTERNMALFGKIEDL